MADGSRLRDFGAWLALVAMTATVLLSAAHGAMTGRPAPDGPGGAEGQAPHHGTAGDGAGVASGVLERAALSARRSGPSHTCDGEGPDALAPDVVPPARSASC